MMLSWGTGPHISRLLLNFFLFVSFFFQSPPTDPIRRNASDANRKEKMEMALQDLPTFSQPFSGYQKLRKLIEPGFKCILRMSGADPGEVKWVNFYPPCLSLPDDGTITFWAVNIVEDISG